MVVALYLILKKTLAEQCGTDGVDAIAHGDDDVKLIEQRVAPNLSHTFYLPPCSIHLCHRCSSDAIRLKVLFTFSGRLLTTFITFPGRLFAALITFSGRLSSKTPADSHENNQLNLFFTFTSLPFRQEAPCLSGIPGMW